MADDLKPQTEKPARARSTTRKSADPSAPKTTKPRSTKAAATKPAATRSVTPEQRYRMVAEAAYHHAEKRGFVGGDPLNDWLLAEIEVDKLLNS